MILLLSLLNDFDYCPIIYNISKSEAIYLLKNSVLHDRGYKKNANQRNEY